MQRGRLVIPVVFFILAGLCTRGLHAQVSPRVGYVGVVSKASIRRPGEKFTFADLQTEHPFVTFPSGNGHQGYAKVFEDDWTIVLVYVAQITGSTETFYINKKFNRFTLIEVGILEANVTGENYKPDITYGTLK